MKQFIKLYVSCLFLCVIFGLSCPAFAEEERPIVLGQSCALTGPAQNLGLEMRAGLLTAFAENNAQGGINGREIVLLSKDDGYEPYRAVNNTLEFINEQNVFMLIGEVGTPTSKAVLPLINKYQIPFFAPFTGAEFLREKNEKLIINVRGSYFQEMEKLASYLIDLKGLSRVACFYQNDSYGLTGLEGIRQALNRRGLSLVSTGSYERNTVAVLGGLQDILEGEPEAVVLVGAYTACAEFIKLSKIKSTKSLWYGNISFVGSKSLKRALGVTAEKVLVSQVVPFPWDTSLPIVEGYNNALRSFQPDFTPGFGSLEGYIAGKLFCMIAKEVNGELTREAFVNTMYRVGKFDLGGLTLVFERGKNQGASETYIIEISPEIKKIDM